MQLLKDGPSWFFIVLMLYHLVTIAVAIKFKKDDRLSGLEMFSYYLTAVTMISTTLLGLVTAMGTYLYYYVTGMDLSYYVMGMENFLILFIFYGGVYEGNSLSLYVVAVYIWSILFWILFVCRAYSNLVKARMKEFE